MRIRHSQHRALQRCGLLEGHGRTTCRVKSCRRPVWHRILLANGLPGRHRWASMCEQCQWCVAQISTTHYSHTQGRLTPEITIDSHTRMQPRTGDRTRGAPRRRDGRATRRAAETGSRDAPGDRRTDPDGMADGQTRHPSERGPRVYRFPARPWLLALCWLSIFRTRRLPSPTPTWSGVSRSVEEQCV